MVTAILLVEADRNALSTLGERIAGIEGVSEVYSVTGQWDFVAMIRIPRHEQLAGILAGPVAGLEGVTRSQTMVAFAAVSTADLDEVFGGDAGPEG